MNLFESTVVIIQWFVLSNDEKNLFLFTYILHKV